MSPRVDYILKADYPKFDCDWNFRILTQDQLIKICAIYNCCNKFEFWYDSGYSFSLNAYLLYLSLGICGSRTMLKKQRFLGMK